MMKRTICLLLTGICAAFLLLWGCYQRGEGRHSGTRGLFSWSQDPLTGDGRELLFRIMKEMELDTLYQAFPFDMEASAVQDFLAAAAEENIHVWLLTGSPEWGLDPDGTAMSDEIRRAVRYKAEGAGFQGVMMDCEPYLTELWEEDPAQVMTNWCFAMRAARETARQEGLILCACIPYYLDSMGFSAQLQTLIEEGCDGLAIMNYYKKKEAEHIDTEVRMAAGAGIPVTVIYELQPPGVHGLKEVNTYYLDGISAVKRSWAMLRFRFLGAPLSMALHEYNALREVVGNE